MGKRRRSRGAGVEKAQNHLSDVKKVGVKQCGRGERGTSGAEGSGSNLALEAELAWWHVNPSDHSRVGADVRTRATIQPSRR
jgi:hypothetical protein